MKELGMIFSEFGKPQIFRSDNGPCYSMPRIQILHAELGNRTQNQFSTLSTEQWFGRIHGQGIQESN